MTSIPLIHFNLTTIGIVERSCRCKYKNRWISDRNRNTNKLILVSISIGNPPYEYKQQEANIPYCYNSSEKIESQQISMSQQMVFFFSF